MWWQHWPLSARREAMARRQRAALGLRQFARGGIYRISRSRSTGRRPTRRWLVRHRLLHHCVRFERAKEKKRHQQAKNTTHARETEGEPRRRATALIWRLLGAVYLSLSIFCRLCLVSRLFVFRFLSRTKRACMRARRDRLRILVHVIETRTKRNQ